MKNLHPTIAAAIAPMAPPTPAPIDCLVYALETLMLHTKINPDMSGFTIPASPEILALFDRLPEFLRQARGDI